MRIRKEKENELWENGETKKKGNKLKSGKTKNASRLKLTNLSSKEGSLCICLYKRGLRFTLCPPCSADFIPVKEKGKREEAAYDSQ